MLLGDVVTFLRGNGLALSLRCRLILGRAFLLLDGGALLLRHVGALVLRHGRALILVLGQVGLRALLLVDGVAALHVAGLADALGGGSTRLLGFRRANFLTFGFVEAEGSIGLFCTLQTAFLAVGPVKVSNSCGMIVGVIVGMVVCVVSFISGLWGEIRFGDGIGQCDEAKKTQT